MTSGEPQPKPPRTALVTGANGYIGSAVARAFQRAGWRVFGLIRRESSAQQLALNEIEPVIGSVLEHEAWLPGLHAHAKAFDAVVSATEDLGSFATHYAGVVATLRAVAEASNAAGVRPLVLFTSGCKDYGRTGLHGEPGLRAQTEDDVLRPPQLLAVRTEHAPRIFEHADVFDAAVLRPTTVWGLTSSLYADAFLRAAEALGSADRKLIVPAYPDAIAHGCHVDDCGDAYVALAEHKDRSKLAGHCFNISGYRYETAREIAEALAKEYGLAGVEYRPEPGTEDTAFGNMLWAFSQWVGSDKIRNLTGWRDIRLPFSENVRAYRLAYEAATQSGHESVVRIRNRLEAVKAGLPRSSVA